MNVILLGSLKSFDKVPHQHLLHTLEYCGIRGQTRQMMKSFKPNRSHKVILEGCKYPMADVISGVSEGTILGPLLFLVFIYDLPEAVQPSDVRLFTDDCLLYKHISSDKVNKDAKIRNRCNQVPHLTQDTNGKVTNLQLDTTNESQEVSPFPAGDHKAQINSCEQRHNKQKTENHK